MSKVFKHYTVKAGIKNKSVTPHTMRRTAATIMIKNGAPPTHVQHLLGHSDFKTTAKYYLGVDDNDLQESHAKYLKYD